MSVAVCIDVERTANSVEKVDYGMLEANGWHCLCLILIDPRHHLLGDSQLNHQKNDRETNRLHPKFYASLRISAIPRLARFLQATVIVAGIVPGNANYSRR